MEAKHKTTLNHCSAKSEQCCDISTYDNLPLPMVMLRGWFNDQCKCFELLYELLSDDEQKYLFTAKAELESVKRKYNRLWRSFSYYRVAQKNKGEHKQLGQLKYASFERWADCVFYAVAEKGSLETLLENIGTVEVAHDVFKYWFYEKPTKLRYLNVADAARILARYGYLEPETRPLLARGALRGAAICLDGESTWKSKDMLEQKYAKESELVSLEERAADFINNSAKFSCFGIWKMEEGENWFCEVVNKGG